jgi:8-oxo-dGTP pyrophosphatase MutT (NUDIX family)
MDKYLELLESLKKGAPGEGSRGGHIIGHTRSGKPVYDSSQHASHAEFKGQDHRDAMNHHYDVWTKTQTKIAEIRKQNPNWNPPKQIHDFLKHHYTQMTMHSSRMDKKESREKEQTKTLQAAAPAKEGFKPLKYGDMSKSAEITPFYAAMVVTDVKREKILLGKRREDGIWTGPGGGAKLGEMPKRAAIREGFEEANLALEESQLEELPMGYAHNNKPVHCFLVTLTPEQVKSISIANDPDKEVPEWKWFSLAEKLPEPMTENRFTTITNAKMHLAGLIMKSSYYTLDDSDGMTAVNPSEQPGIQDESFRESLEHLMADYKPGDEPVRIQVNGNHILNLVRIADGLYSGFVKKNEQAINAEIENVMTIDKMTLADLVGMMKLKGIEPMKTRSAEEIGLAYAAEMDHLSDKIAEQEQAAQARVEMFNQFPEPQNRKQESQITQLVDALMGMTVNGNVNITIQKAKALPIGTVRQWGVYKYVKHSEGWVVMGGEHHGKLMGDFKSQPKYADYARHHENSTPKQDEPKPSKKTEAVDGGDSPKEDPKTEAPAAPENPKEPPKKEAPKEISEQERKNKIAENEKRIAELTAKLEEAKQAQNNPKPEEPKSEEPGTEELTPEQKKFAKENEDQVLLAVAREAHTMSLKQYMDHATKRQYDQIVKMNTRKGPNGEEPTEEAKKQTEASVKSYMERKKRTYNAAFKEQHRKMTEVALKAGLKVSEEALKEYPGLGGSDLPEEMDAELNNQTNMVKALDFGTSSKAIKKKFATHVNTCNQLVASMGIKFKTPMTFKATGLGSLGKRTRGTYYDRDKVIELKDMAQANKTLMHEIGHALDYAMSENSTRGRHQEMVRPNSNVKPELKKMYEDLHDVVMQSDYYQLSSSAHGRYLRTPTEVFARAFEVYAFKKAEDAKMPKEFMDTFIPDVFKTKDPEISKIQKEMRDLELGGDDKESSREERMQKREELRKQYFQKIEKTDGGWSVVDEDRQAEYKNKVSELMEKILKEDQIKKAMQELDLAVTLQKSEAFQKASGHPIGTVRIWQGQKFIKQGDGHWAPMPSNPAGSPAKQEQKTAETPTTPETKQEASPEEAGPIDHLKPEKNAGGHVDVHSKDLDHALKQGPVSIISAGRNQNHDEDRGLPDDHINARHKRLEQDLKDKGYKYTKVKDKYGVEGDSFMVYHGDEDHLNELGKKYNQESVIHAKEGKNKLHYTSGESEGKHHKGEGHQEVPDADDYYSHVKTSDGKDKKFSLGLDFGKLHDADKKTEVVE